MLPVTSSDVALAGSGGFLFHLRAISPGVCDSTTEARMGWGCGGGGGGTSGSEVFMKHRARMGGCRFIKGDPA